MMQLKYIFKLVFISLFFFGIFIFFFGKKTDITQIAMKSELIVCLGGGYVERLDKGIELYKKGFANKIIFTGPGIGLSDCDDKIGFWKIPFFIEHGVKKKDIVFLEHMQNTYAEIKEIKKYMLKHKYKTVLIVSDPPHSRRIKYLVELFEYKKYKLNARIIGSDVEWWSKIKFIDSVRSFWEATKEIIALAYYHMRY